jgi:hypothetical protein
MQPLRAITLVASILALAVLSPVAEAKKAKKPSAGTISKLLRKHYTEGNAGYTSIRANWKVSGKVTYGAPKVTSNYYKYGVDGKTRIFPVKLKSVYTQCDLIYNKVDVDRISAKYVFFRDEFGAWTFRITDEHRTDPSAQHQPPGTACPV